jgi:hypothetical protein
MNDFSLDERKYRALGKSERCEVWTKKIEILARERCRRNLSLFDLSGRFRPAPACSGFVP